MPNTVRIDVDDTDHLLNADMYGVGAIVRLQSATAVGEVYGDVTTVLLVSGTYTYWAYDPVGGDTTWYRQRYENNAGTRVSAWSDPRLASELDSYLTVDEFRLFVTTSLSDPAVQMLLDAAAQAIVATAGKAGLTTCRLAGGRGPLLLLPTPALAAYSVMEDDVYLGVTDYEVSPTGLVIRRLDSGTHPQAYWGREIVLTYIPRDDIADRQRVQRELVALDLAYQPGLTSQTIGTWSEAYNQGAPYPEQRAAILATLGTGGVMVL